ncbi:YbaB/EbfC family nucleoid-associated protein [Amycolatopsis sp. NPDC059657]|uniref:YbaB/EbfC family nucleoid-associated protein n=1 Tax=Amycolatopsis sp. NPDC059657 TaxID=3346899 RepID=UPI003671D05B
MADHEAKLAQSVKAFEEQAAKAGELKDKIAQLKGHARNPDGSITVTVAPSGAVLGLQLSPLAMRRSHTQLQQEILATIRQATQQAAGLMMETVTPLLGDRAAQFQEALNAHAPQPALGPTAPPPPNTLPPPNMPPPQAPTPVRTPRRGPADEEPDEAPSTFLQSEPRPRRNPPRPAPVNHSDDEDFFSDPLRG